MCSVAGKLVWSGATVKAPFHHMDHAYAGGGRDGATAAAASASGAHASSASGAQAFSASGAQAFSASGAQASSASGAQTSSGRRKKSSYRWKRQRAANLIVNMR